MLEFISIHALREEGDRASTRETENRSDFYPRPPRGGRRLPVPSDSRFHRISIHALREEGDGRRGNHDGFAVPISIHALREEGDVTLTLKEYV